MSADPTPDADARYDRADARYDRVARSAGNRTLTLLLGPLETADRVAGQFAEDHAGGCGCDYCRGVQGWEHLGRDADGMRWALAQMVSVVEGVTHRTQETDGATFGDDLRALARLADELDAEEADEPTAVVGPQLG